MNNVIATLVAVVVTLLLIVVAVVIGQQLFTAGNAQKAVSEIQALNQAALSLVAGQNNWGSQDLTAALASSGLAPADMISGSSLYDPWGGGVAVFTLPGANCWGPAGNHPGQCVEIDFGNVPSGDCAQMVAALPVACGMGAVYVAGNWNCGAGLTPAWAAGVCNGASVNVQYGQN